ncbi:MAG: hypothetical protein M3460_17915 [Actinomycetota bacterium]|nr:hypothetical protein [Actinomycetota bacterium]
MSARAQALTNAGEAGARPCSTARTKLTDTEASRASLTCVQPGELALLTHTIRKTGAPTEHGAPASTPTMANH